MLMRFEALAYFLEIAESGSFTQASKRLFVSQQGLSKAIKALEKELGCRLFEKDGATLKLSAAGRALAPHARQCLADLDALREDMGPFARMASPRRMAGEAPPTLHAAAFVTDSLFSLLDRELRQAGLHDVTIIEHSYTEILAALEMGTATHVYALGLPSSRRKELERIPHVVFEPLFETEIMLAGSRQFIHPDKGAFSLEKVSKLPVAYYNDPLLNSIISEMFREHPLQNVVTHASNPSRISEYVADGKAVTFTDGLSDFLSRDKDAIISASIKGAARFFVGFAYLDHANVSESSLGYVRAFKECFRTRCATYLAGQQPFE